MPSEPEKPIESLLRRYARKRRERTGGAWSLHPTTRRLLQEEVARKFARNKRVQGAGLLHWISQDWLRPIAATAVIAVIAVAAWLFLAGNKNPKTDSGSIVSALPGSPTSGVVQLAVNNLQETMERKLSSPAEETKQALRPTASEDVFTKRALSESLSSQAPESRLARGKKDADLPAAAPELVAQDKVSQTATAFGLNSASPAATPQQPAAGSPTAGAASAAAGISPALASARDSAAAQLPGVANEPLAVSPSSPLLDVVKSALITTNLVQYGMFTGSQMAVISPSAQKAELRTPSVPSARSAMVARNNSVQQVLTSFHLEQSGNQLRVIDSDGSVYSGSIQTTDLTVVAEVYANRAFFENNQLAKRPIQGTVNAIQANGQHAATPVFELIGTNKSLNRRLVFSGELSTNRNTVLGRFNYQGRAAGPGVDANRVQADRNFDQLHVSGTAVIEGEPPIRIEAEPAAQ